MTNTELLEFVLKIEEQLSVLKQLVINDIGDEFCWDGSESCDDFKDDPTSCPDCGECIHECLCDDFDDDFEFEFGDDIAWNTDNIWRA